MLLEGWAVLDDGRRWSDMWRWARVCAMIRIMKLQHLVVLGCLVAVGIWLLNSPKCTGDCKKIAAHLTTQGITGIVTGLLAA